MKCKVCHKRIPKHQQICPHCGMRIEEDEVTQVTPVHKHFKHNAEAFFIGFIVFAVLMYVLLFSGPGFHLFTSQILFKSPMPYHGTGTMTFEMALEEHYEKEIATTMIEERDNLLEVLNKSGFTNIQKQEEYRIEDYYFQNATLTITASKKDYDYKVVVSYKRFDGKVKSLSIAGSSLISEQQFEIKEEDVRDLLVCMNLENGYQLLEDGYSKMTKALDNQYQYASYGDYDVFMNRNVYNSTYSFSYTVGY